MPLSETFYQFIEYDRLGNPHGVVLRKIPKCNVSDVEFVVHNFDNELTSYHSGSYHISLAGAMKEFSRRVQLKLELLERYTCQ